MENKVTIFNLSKKSHQEIFDHVCDHLLKQRKQSIDIDKDANSCQYLSRETGHSCAIGSMIPRENYKEFIENKGVDDMLICYGIAVDSPKAALLQCLQNAHDCVTQLEDGEQWIRLWVFNMQLVADVFELNTYKLLAIAPKPHFDVRLHNNLLDYIYTIKGVDLNKYGLLSGPASFLEVLSREGFNHHGCY